MDVALLLSLTFYLLVQRWRFRGLEKEVERLEKETHRLRNEVDDLTTQVEIYKSKSHTICINGRTYSSIGKGINVCIAKGEEDGRSKEV